MPIYEYRCPNGHVFEILQRMDEPPPGKCEVCGAKVERGHVLGTAGRILAGIPGMYFEMRVDGKPVDPLEWLKKKP